MTNRTRYTTELGDLGGLGGRGIAKQWAMIAVLGESVLRTMDRGTFLGDGRSKRFGVFDLIR